MIFEEIDPVDFPEINRTDLERRGLDLVWAIAAFNNIQDETRMLALVDREDEKKLPLVVDFLSDEITYRRRHGLAAKQPFPKALGLKSVQSGVGPTVVDATAGLGTDAFLMAAMGCRVRALERSPVLFALLSDGLMRLKNFIEDNRGEESEYDPEAIARLAQIADHLSFEFGDALTSLQEMQKLSADARPEIIYLDPMYPSEGHSKSALPKKTMQLFRRLIGEDHDADRVFDVARKTALVRVVVKRPLHAQPLADQKPTHTFEGKTARYDMYLPH